MALTIQMNTNNLHLWTNCADRSSAHKKCSSHKDVVREINTSIDWFEFVVDNNWKIERVWTRRNKWTTREDFLSLSHLEWVRKQLHFLASVVVLILHRRVFTPDIKGMADDHYWYQCRLTSQSKNNENDFNQIYFRKLSIKKMSKKKFF